MPQLICPGQDELTQFVLGQIPDSECQYLEEHLSHCHRCGDTIHHLKAEDTLVDAVRTQAAVIDEPESQVVEDLIRRLSCRGPIAGENGVLETSFLSLPERADEIGRFGQ